MSPLSQVCSSLLRTALTSSRQGSSRSCRLLAAQLLTPWLFKGPSRTISSALSGQLQLFEKRHSDVQQQLMAPNVDPKDLAKLGRELASLDKVVGMASRWKKIVGEVDDLTALLRDGESGSGGPDAAELIKMAKAELEVLQPQLDNAEESLIRLLLPRDEADTRDAIVELRAGVGGEEAALFAGEVFRMYEMYCIGRGWQWQPLMVQKAEDFGGMREAVVSVTGAGAFGRLRYESGVHRVQRVPITQSTGKLQTSTMTVAVLAEAEEVDIDIAPGDLKIETYRAGGAGGQHVNKTESAVRITHLPSGLIVAIQDERSQMQNRVKAMRVLRARLYEAERERIASVRSKERKSQIGTSSRSDRVRTYNFTQNRVTDHRVGISKHDVTRFMAGEDLEEVFDALQAASEEEQLAALEDAMGGDSVTGGRRGSRRKAKQAMSAAQEGEAD